IIKYKHESEIVNEKIMNYYKDRLDNFLLKLDISAFFNQNNINFDPTAYKGMNEVEFINKIDSFVKSNYSKMKSIVFESFDQKYLSEILKESNELSKIYYKAFKTLKNDDWTENEIYLKPCKPINSLDISEYLKVNDNIDEHILDCKENDDELKIYELCTINPIQLGFPLSAFDAYNIFDVMLNNTRFKDKITDKLVKACKNAVKSSK
ncbi:MAG: hypothetical protein IJS50_06420, partial [Desulfovibrio sp.]|nr:hypothetical protein [Desulfovibrio sp.]